MSRPANKLAVAAINRALRFIKAFLDEIVHLHYRVPTGFQDERTYTVPIFHERWYAR
jgi:hypothetical protein